MINLSEEARQRIANNSKAEILSLLNSGDSPQQVMINMQNSASDTKMDLLNDGVNPNSILISEDDEEDCEPSDTTNSNFHAPALDNCTPEVRKTKLLAWKELVRADKENTNYYRNDAERKPATSQDIKDSFGDSDSYDFDNLEKLIKQKADEMKLKCIREASQKAAQSKSTDWKSDSIAYTSDSYLDADGNKKTFQKAVEKVNWGSVLSKEAKSPEDAIARLRSFITYSVKEKFGGLNRIKSIVVRGQQLIINDVCYLPVIEPQYLKQDIFPVDTVEYIKCGLLAPLFDWGSLKKMPCLSYLDIDDKRLFVESVADDLGIGRRIGVSSIFNVCSNLETFVLGGDHVTRDELNKPEARAMKESVAQAKRFQLWNDGYKLNIYDTTNSFQSYTMKNLKDYATNRGNKGIFRFCCGTMARFGLATGAGLLNLGTHILGGVGKVIKEAMTDVTPDDLK